MAEEKVIRSKGVVTKFNENKGYGFIQPDEGGEELFVHQTAIKSDGYRTLREGQVVEFVIILDGDKTKASDVTAPGGGPLNSTLRRGDNSNRRRGGYGFDDRRNSGNGYGYRGGGSGECFNCGEYGHRARDCNGGGGVNGSCCYNCGGYGHLARECPSEARRGRGGNSGACYTCGELGHMARDCMHGGGYSRGGGGFGRLGGGGAEAGSGGKCFNCGQSGHFARECLDALVWPGVLSNAGIPQLSTTGFALNPGNSIPISAPTSWSGRFWGRTLCSQDYATGKFTCVTGDCGSGNVECSGAGATPPVTLSEFTLNGADGLDFYDVSLVDGYNLPMLVVPQNGTGGNCTVTGCVADLNDACPSDLAVVNAFSTSSSEGANVACKSACEAFQEPQYCCSGEFGTPETCKPSTYSEFFKNTCPQAYSYAYDDGTSTFTCASADYVITFCPTPSASNKKSSEGGDQIVGSAAGGVSLVSSGGVKIYFQFTAIVIIFLSQLWRLH